LRGDADFGFLLGMAAAPRPEGSVPDREGDAPTISGFAGRHGSVGR
jgi:hypothetical protein